MQMLQDILRPINLRLLQLSPWARALTTFLILGTIGSVVWALVVGATGVALLWGAWFGALGIYFGFRLGYFAERLAAQLPDETMPYPHPVRRMPGGFGMRDWDAAEYLHADEAQELMQPDERVIGFEIDGAAVAYPLRVMALREVANEDVAGLPVSISWSGLTYAARAWVARDPRGEPIVLAPTGRAMFNSPMLESENGTWYLQMSGEALSGPDAGHQLTERPCTLTTWEAWSSAWPETEVMSPEGSPMRDVFENYYASDRPGLFRQPARDRALPNKDVVVGIIRQTPTGTREQLSRVYSAHELRELPLVQERVDGAELLVVCERGSATYCIFDRAQVLADVADAESPSQDPPAGVGDADPDVGVDEAKNAGGARRTPDWYQPSRSGRADADRDKHSADEVADAPTPLTFVSHSDNEYRPNRVVEKSASDDDQSDDAVDDAGGATDSAYEAWLLRDEQTGSIWQAATGRCIEGELRGTRLRMLPSRTAFWFAWNKVNSDVSLTRLQGAEADAGDGEGC